MTEGSSKKEAGHMTEEEVGIQMIEEGLGGAERKVDLEIETGLVQDLEVRKKVLIVAES